MKNIFAGRKMNNKGFTMIEMIIVVAIIAILCAISIAGVSFYLDSADKNERDYTAKTVFLGMQEYLTDLKKNGKLEEFNKKINANEASGFINETQMQKVLMDYYGTGFTSFYEDYKVNHAGTKLAFIVYEGGDKSSPVYDLLFRCLGNEDILDNPFVIEYNQTTGIVQSVFYSKQFNAFDKTNLYSEAVLDKSNIVRRDAESIDQKKQGYYGIYSTAVKAEPYVYDVETDNYYELINDDRMYLHIHTAYAEGDSYLVTLKENSKDIVFKEYSFNLASLKDSSTDLKTKKLSEVLDTIDKKDGSTPADSAIIYGAEAGVADIYIVIDCEHTNRMEENYLKLMKAGGVTSPEKTTFSAKVISSSEGEIPLNDEADIAVNPIFAGYDEANDIYEISCTRHLNNIRDFKTGQKYRLTGDINLKTYEREEEDPVVATVSDGSDRHWCMQSGNRNASHTGNELDSTFQALTCFDTVNNKEIYFSGIIVGVKDKIKAVNVIKNDESAGDILLNVKSEECFSITGVVMNMPTSTNVGFLTTVDKDSLLAGINLDGFKISGKYYVGAATGKNDGTVVGVFVNDSIIQGTQIVGGIIGQSSNEVVNCVFSGGDVESNGDSLTALNDDGVNISYRAMGGVVGVADKIVKKCVIKDSLINNNASAYNSKNIRIGGIVGFSKASADVSYCDAYGVTVKGSESVGGLIGYGRGNVENCNLYGNSAITGYGSSNVAIDKKIIAKAEGNIHPVGGIVGYIDKGMHISECNIDNTDGPITVRGYEAKEVGGVAGSNHGYVDKCTAKLDYVHGKLDTGGIVGKLYGDISNSTMIAGSIIGDSTGYIGGAVGVVGAAGQEDIYQSVIDNVVVEAAVDIDANGTKSMGGIFGSSDKNVLVKNCINRSTIRLNNDNTQKVGGIGGGQSDAANYQCKAQFINCVNYGDIIFAKNGTNTGGITGYFELDITVKDCKNYGNISSVNGSLSKAGGLVGVVKRNPVIEDSINYGNIEALSMSTVGGLIGEILDSDYLVDGKAYSLNSLGGCSNEAEYMKTTGGMSNVGGIVGLSNGTILFGNVKNSADIIFGNGADKVSAIVAYSKRETKLSNITNTGKIKGLSGAANKVAGVLALCDGNVTLTNCVNEGDIEINCSGDSIGGIGARLSNYVTLNACENSGNILNACDDKELKNIGGLIGYNANSQLTISGGKNTGEISLASKNSNVGGFIGYSDANWGQMVLSSIESTGTIKTYGNGYLKNAGGFIGYAKNINDSLNDVSVDCDILDEGKGASESVGGVIGYAESYFKFSRLTYNGNITFGGKVTNCGGILGKANMGIYTNNTSGDTNLVATADITVNGDAYNVGGVFGYLEGYANINKIAHKGKLIINAKSIGVGGVIGAVNSGMELDTASHAGDIISENENVVDMDRISAAIGRINNSSYVSVGKVTAEGNINLGSNNILSAGGIIGNSTGSFVVTKSQFTGDIAAGKLKNTGGISGYVQGSLSATDDTYTGNLISKGYIESTGGLAGYTKGSLDATNVKATSKIITDANMKNVGGLVGSHENVVYMSTVYADVDFVSKGTGNSEAIGGLVADLNYASWEKIENITLDYSMDFSGKLSNAGGITGTINTDVNKDITKFSSAVKGSISTKGDTGCLYSVGGLIGYSKGIYEFKGIDLDISFTDNGGASSSYVGGIIGRNYKDITVNSGSKIKVKYDLSENVNKGTLSNIGGIAGTSESQLRVDGISSVDFELSNKTKAISKNIGGVVGCITENGSASINKLNKVDFKYTDTNDNHSDNNYYIGGLIGFSKGNVTITDIGTVDFDYSSTQGIDSAAGLVARFEGPNKNPGSKELSIKTTDSSKKIKVNINVKSGGTGFNIGAVAGCTKYAKGYIENISCDGDISSDVILYYAGGIHGNSDVNAKEYKLVNCDARVNLASQGEMKYCGGIIGMIHNDTKADVHGNYNMGNISYGNAINTGGIAGYIEYSSGEMYNNYYGGIIERTSSLLVTAKEEVDSGYVAGFVKISKTDAKFQDNYSYEGVTSLENLKRIGRDANESKINLKNTDWVVYQTKTVKSIVTEKEFKKLQFVYKSDQLPYVYEYKGTEDKESDIRHLVEIYKRGWEARNIDDYPDNTVRITFNMNVPEDLDIKAVYNSQSYGDSEYFEVDKGTAVKIGVTGTIGADQLLIVKEGVNVINESGNKYITQNINLYDVYDDMTIDIIVEKAPVMSVTVEGTDGTELPYSEWTSYIKPSEISIGYKDNGDGTFTLINPKKRYTLKNNPLQKDTAILRCYYDGVEKIAPEAGNYYDSILVTGDSNVKICIMKTPIVKVIFENEDGTDFIESNTKRDLSGSAKQIDYDSNSFTYHASADEATSMTMIINTDAGDKRYLGKTLSANALDSSGIPRESEIPIEITQNGSKHTLVISGLDSSVYTLDNPYIVRIMIQNPVPAEDGEQKEPAEEDVGLPEEPVLEEKDKES